MLQFLKISMSKIEVWNIRIDQVKKPFIHPVIIQINPILLYIFLD